MVTVPEIEIDVKLTGEQCRNMIASNAFTSDYQTTHGIALNEENVFSVNEMGMTHTGTDGNIWCEGERIKFAGQFIDNVLVLTQYRVTIQTEEFLTATTSTRMLKKIEALNDHVILPCSASVGTCSQGGWTYVWEANEVLCPLMKVQNGNFEKEGDFLVDHNLKLLFKPTDTTEGVIGCPPGSVIRTDQSDIVLTKTMEGYKWIDHQFDPIIYTNQKDDYLMYTLEKQTAKMKKSLREKICAEEYTKEGIIQLEEDIFSKRRGDVLFIFECPTNTAKIKPMEGTCTNKIPIENNLYVDPITRVASKHASKTDCSTFFPLTIKSDDGWISITQNEVQLVTAPPTLHEEHLKTKHESMKGVGIYQPDQIAQFEDILEYGNFHSAIIETLGYGICRKQEGPCEEIGSQESSYRPVYDLRRLEERTMEMFSFGKNIQSWITEIGSYLSAIVIIGWIIQASIILTMTIMTGIQHGLKECLSVLYAVLCFWPSQIGKQRMQSARPEEKDDIFLRPA